MTTKRKRIIKNAEVIVIEGPHSGAEGTVVRLLNKKILHDTLGTLFRPEAALKLPEWTHHQVFVPVSSLRHRDEVSDEQYAELQALWRHTKLEQERREKEWEDTRRAAARERYVAQRKEWQELLRTAPEVPVVGRQGDTYIEYEVMGRNLITTYQGAQDFSSPYPRAEVNWSAIGSVSPEQAIVFARALLQVAEGMLTQRAALEQAHPDLVEALRQ